jgi:hypothetical protein
MCSDNRRGKTADRDKGRKEIGYAVKSSCKITTHDTQECDAVLPQMRSDNRDGKIANRDKGGKEIGYAVKSGL